MKKTMKEFMSYERTYRRYSELVKNYGFDRADKIIETECANWDVFKEDIWQKYDYQVLLREN